MTKVKDLITVAADNVFVHFPIDTERYELRVALGRRWACRVNGGYAGVLPSEDVHLNSAVFSLEETLGLSAKALAATSFRPNDKHTRLTQDRAYRARGSLDRDEYRDAIRCRTEEKCAAKLLTYLLGRLYWRLASESLTLQLSPKDGGNPT
jgi:hypothetical protein